MIRLLKRLNGIDWTLVVLILAFSVLQVWCMMLLTDSIQDLIASITRISYHNHPESLGEGLYAMYMDLGGSWEAVKAALPGLGLTPEAEANVLAVADASTSEIWHNALLLLAFAAGATGCQVVTAFSAAKISSSLATRTRHDIIRAIDSFSLAETNRFTAASLVTRSTNDINQVQFCYLFLFRTLFSVPVTAIWAICKIQASSFELTWVTVIAVVLLVIGVGVTMGMLIPKFRIVQKHVDRLNLQTRENVAGVRVIRAYNGETFQEEKFDKANKDLYKLNRYIGNIFAVMMPAMTLLMNGASLAMYWIGAHLINAGTVDYATVAAFMMLSSQVIMAFLGLLFMLAFLPRAAVSARRINEVLDTKPSIASPEAPVTPNESGTIVFDDVCFRYADGDNDALSHISFEAKKGDTIAVLGATGSGKTTLVQMIDRMTDATGGRILVDGVDVRDQDLESLRRRVGFVPQKAFLFKGTVASNLRLGAENAELEELKQAAEVACADSFISEMEGGYDAAIAQGGTNVSGGQRQRLCIARAILAKPEILVFDDSFSALDFRTDRQVRENLAKTLEGTTKVIVAQRIGTIMDADQILLLENGELADKGTHKELLARSELYRSIALSQLTKEELGI